MKPQHYSNHRQLVPTYHILTLAAMVVLLTMAIYYLVSDSIPSWFMGVFLVLLVLTLISVSLHARSFALRVQDRAIRAEENLRYYILTGKRLSQQLTLQQLIALRFANDEEFIQLTERALRENLSSKEIKKSIKSWRADYYRA